MPGTNDLKTSPAAPDTESEEIGIIEYFCGLSELVQKSPDHTNTTVIARKVTKSNPCAATASFLT